MRAAATACFGGVFVRHSNSLLIAAAGIILWSAATAAAGQTATGVTATPDDVTVTAKRLERDKRVCKSEVSVGHIMPKKVCKSKGQWEDERQRALVMIERLKDDRNSQRHTRAALENSP
jgi:hypothetical protein